MGVVVDSPFQVFSSFPDALIETLEQATNHTFIGNKAASGTQILAELGHVETETNGSTLILYTSADSVLQICGNEEIIGLEELYRVCQTAREITMQPQWKVGRVIARPWIIYPIRLGLGRYPISFPDKVFPKAIIRPVRSME